jgi:hypothetical protein
MVVDVVMHWAISIMVSLIHQNGKSITPKFSFASKGYLRYKIVTIYGAELQLNYAYYPLLL